MLIDSDGETLLAEGFHQRKGGPHAEAAALADARARGVTPEQFGRATAYVTLEPCHRGPGKTTPPCDEALVGAGIRMLHVAGLRCTHIRMWVLYYCSMTCYDELARPAPLHPVRSHHSHK